MQTARQRSLSKGKSKYHLSWLEYLKLLDALVYRIKKSKIKFDYVYGIPRGGLIPATIVSHELNVPFLLNDNIKRNKTILIVDDICDKGETLKPFLSLNRSMIKTATLFRHRESKVTPDFYIHENTKWIQFPYEKE